MIRLIIALLAALSFTAPAFAETWYKAETRHFTIYSDGKSKQLGEFAAELERFDALLRFKWSRDAADTPNRVTIYLLKDADAVDDLLDTNGATIAGFYKAQPEGSFMVANRKESSYRGTLTGKQVVFHEYGHHFFFQNFQIPAAAWFVEGFADYVATAVIKDDGHWELGRPNGNSQLLMAYGGNWDIRELLTSTPFEQGHTRWRYFYGWSWGLTHMLYSKEQDRGAKITTYLSLINSGVEPLAAAEQAFGDLDELKKAVRAYVLEPTTFQKSVKPLVYDDAVTVSELSDYDSRTVRLTVERLSSKSQGRVRDRLLEHASKDWATAEAWYQLAEAEFTLADAEYAEKSDDWRATNTAIDKALERDPSHMLANVMKGRMLLKMINQTDQKASENYPKSREYFQTAQKAQPGNPWPIYNYARSLQLEGLGEQAISPALKSAFEIAPEAAQYRFAYAYDLARQGEFDKAIELLRILANNPHGTRGADRAIEQIKEMREYEARIREPAADDPVVVDDMADNNA